VFVDEAVISVKAGNGGAGAVSFRREKYVPKGGPDGGNGGDGGNVILVGDENINTLYDFRGRFHWEAGHGEDGRAKQQSGAAGADCIVRVPPGTLVYEARSGQLLADLKNAESAVIARGGKGGWGNEHYKRSTNQTPRRADAGEPGEARELRLELKLIADVGIIGLPNAGKSTLLAALSRATPKIADYPFTTLSPQLGVAEVDATRRLVIADIPGLIEGAAKGAGLGHDFLRHVERTRVLLHLLDAHPPDGSDPAESYRKIRAELHQYSPLLSEKQELIVLNKMDLVPEGERGEAAAELRRKLRLGHQDDVVAISGAARQNLRDLLERLWALAHPSPVAAGERWKGLAAPERS
jgi:GTP-binding protein